MCPCMDIFSRRRHDADTTCSAYLVSTSRQLESQLGVCESWNFFNKHFDHVHNTWKKAGKTCPAYARDSESRDQGILKDGRGRVFRPFIRAPLQVTRQQKFWLLTLIAILNVGIFNHCGTIRRSILGEVSHRALGCLPCPAQRECSTTRAGGCFLTEASAA